MNEVAPFAGSQQTTDLAERLNAFKKTAPKTSDGSIYIKMAKDGEWTFGASDEQVEKADRWAVNPFSVRQGYICWSKDPDHKGGPLDERMYDNAEDVVPKAAMPDIENGKWNDQLEVSMQCLTEPNQGLDVVYKVNSMSGVGAINGLVDSILAQAQKSDKHVPVLRLDWDKYIHKKHGKIYTPVLEIVDWMTMDGTVEAEQVEAPKRKARRGAEPEPTLEEELEPAPVRRRRKTS